MQTKTWGQFEVPEWSLRYREVQALIEQHSADQSETGSSVCVSSSEMVRDGAFPPKIHRTLQKLEVPYDFAYCLSEDIGLLAGGWRPGMQTPVRFWISCGERVFRESEIRKILESSPLPREQVRVLTELFDQERRALTPLDEMTDSRPDQAEEQRLVLKGASRQHKLKP